MTPNQRKSIIHNEIIVDAYDDYEVNMSWYYYFEEEITFPISAIVKLKKGNGQYENVKVNLVEIYSDEGSELMFGLVLTMKDYVFPLHPKDIVQVDTSEENQEILNHWLFWKDLPLLK